MIDELRNKGQATAGNNKSVHIVRLTLSTHFTTMCGLKVPRKPQTTQEQLPKCRRCFGGGTL